MRTSQGPAKPEGRGVTFSFSNVPLPGVDVSGPGGRRRGSSPLASMGASAIAVPSGLPGMDPRSHFTLQEGCVGSGRAESRKGGNPVAWVAQGVEGALDDHLFSTFREMDASGRGLVYEADLLQYAARHGLPTEYVRHFIQAVIKAASRAVNKEPSRRSFDYKAFRAYANSREAALRRAFDLFDVDRDGSIDSAELERGLSHVRVCCPKSGCVYKNRQQCVRDLLGRVDFDGSKSIEFWEFRKFFLLLPQDDMLVEYWLSARSGAKCDIAGCVVLRGDEKARGKPWGHLFAGAMAGVTSRTATAPLETLRLRGMTGAIPLGLSPMDAAKSLVEQSGWRALYRGNLTNVLRSAPQKALDFFAFDAYKTALASAVPAGPLHSLTAAGLAGATSNFILYPLEVVRSRLTVDATARYRGVADALVRIVREEGAPALYRGVGPSVLAIIPEAAITYGLFDLLKKSYTKLSAGREPSIVQSLSFGVFSAFMGQVVAFPLETVSRRLQVQGGGEFMGALNNVLREGGPRALYRGIGPACLRVVPMAVVSFGTYEGVKLWINALEERADARRARKECGMCPQQCYGD
ncbi:unnamed protein product [Ostreobium quekettii]|uniref:EF-hand domain-containing protein n=1 Tax=Ostreobium quekettii TaxID=121088 RepID=A0A8S1J5B9_9CHLO|nr:unnamed protein product [Ostreobium quekettii]|eukprot:evm.model.scf_3088.1 EVM.evm.TU.scf_3088.1   scf_3088:851-2587(+)